MNDDLISRQRLLKELKHRKELFCRNRIEFLGLSKNDKARVDEIDNCIAKVINVPSAQPELSNNSTKLDRDSGEFVTILDCTGCRYEFRADYCCQYCVRRYKDRYVKREDQE